MKRNYYEDAEEQQAKADALDQRLANLNKTIAQLERRDDELRVRLLEP